MRQKNCRSNSLMITDKKYILRHDNIMEFYSTWKEWSVNTHYNMNQSENNCVVWKKADTK